MKKKKDQHIPELSEIMNETSKLLKEKGFPEAAIDPEHLSIDQPGDKKAYELWDVPSESYDAAEQLLNEQETSKGEPLKPDRTFTLQDMLDIHREGAHNANTFCGYPSELNKYLNNCVSDYMRYKFEIDIPKQQ